MIATQSQLIHMNTEIYDFQVGHSPLMDALTVIGTSTTFMDLQLELGLIRFMALLSVWVH